ncbi:flagellar motor switch protein FliN [Paludibacterium paludis]|uniref:Flagellar motor switch protein FliN n=1 Tax=Paludibacterium paludis TaxID=1225769 RepID=A0A918U6W5_9NEIS|nr:flagellar motor switch protein FliN [Paludibacterium paludis]GGY04573.1 hypothetical protein GCM10011289_03860 [Paludibacterium paludis]
MDLTENFDLESALDDTLGNLPEAEEAAAPQPAPRRDLNPFMRKIPVTLTLEVGAVEIPLSELFAIEHGSVLELDKHAGEPLDIKINGTRVGRAEVVVVGENYGLRVVELENLDMGLLSS